MSYDRNAKLDITLSPTYGDNASTQTNQSTRKLGLEVAFELDADMLKEREYAVTFDWT